MPPSNSSVEAAARAVRAGGLAVYPTETVYGLGADALDPDAVERVYETKGRPREKPLSLAVPAVADIEAYAVLGERERAFAEAFLPGPVTLVCERRPAVPDRLVAGQERVGVRVPDHETALALLERVAPLTATSANLSGAGSVRRVADLDPAVRERATVVDGGETPGGESTVVDVAAGDLIRRGQAANAVEAWLQERA